MARTAWEKKKRGREFRERRLRRSRGRRWSFLSTGPGCWRKMGGSRGHGSRCGCCGLRTSSQTDVTNDMSRVDLTVVQMLLTSCITLPIYASITDSYVTARSPASWRASMSLDQMVLAGFPLRFCFRHPL